MRKPTLVIGASLKTNRYSNKAILMLNAHGYPVNAIGLRDGKVGSTEIWNFNLIQEKQDIIKNKLDTVTLYLNPKRQELYYDFILRLSPKRVIFNPGTENIIFYELLRKQGIKVEVACTLVLLTTGQY